MIGPRVFFGHSNYSIRSADQKHTSLIAT